MRFTLVLLTTALFLCNCKKETVFKKYIQNDSDQAINFYFFGSNNPVIYGDTVSIAAHESKVIFSFFEENSSVAIPQACEIYPDSISVEVVGGGNLQKSLTNSNHWDYTESDNDQICTFVITNADIQ